MRKDFTINIYIDLLDAISEAGYTFQTYRDFLRSPAESSVILRHDVDSCPEIALRFAKIQQEKGIKGTYYFRILKRSWDEETIRAIASMGHEVGLHYEDVDLVRKMGFKDKDSIIDRAYEHFCFHLARLRELVPVDTICKHGSPLSPYDNKLIWTKYSYKNLGIMGEPYLDTDFKRVGYLTDTGRRWNGQRYSIRDFAGHDALSFPQIKTTGHLIKEFRKKDLPDQIMLTFHPQRWNIKIIPWLSELIFQKFKNVIKRFIIRTRVVSD